MSDQTNINQPDGERNSNGNIMKELSDIKSSLAVNTSETGNIKASIVEIKGDIKEIKSKYITYEQHKEVQEEIKCLKTDSESLKSFRDTLIGKMWGIGVIAGLVTSFLGIIANHFINK